MNRPKVRSITTFAIHLNRNYSHCVVLNVTQVFHVYITQTSSNESDDVINSLNKAKEKLDCGFSLQACQLNCLDRRMTVSTDLRDAETPFNSQCDHVD